MARFNENTLAKLLDKLGSLKVDKSPFDVMAPGSSRFGRPKDVPIYWVKPELVARVKFAEWTNDGHLRAPSFIGLRDDKPAKEVHREIVAPPPDDEEDDVPAKKRARGEGAEGPSDDGRKLLRRAQTSIHPGRSVVVDGSSRIQRSKT